MGFRFSKRINLFKGFGITVSKSGISSSLRTKSGSVGPKYFSFNTGIPGLSYRRTFRKSGSCLFLLFVYGVLFLVLVIVTKSIQ